MPLCNLEEDKKECICLNNILDYFCHVILCLMCNTCREIQIERVYNRPPNQAMTIRVEGETEP